MKKRLIHDSIDTDYKIPVAPQNQHPFLTAKLSTNMQSAVYGQNCKQSYFNEPVLFRAARCAESPATIRVLLHRPYYRVVLKKCHESVRNLLKMAKMT